MTRADIIGKEILSFTNPIGPTTTHDTAPFYGDGASGLFILFLLTRDF